MKKILIISFLVLGTTVINAVNPTDSVLTVLDQEIANASTYYLQKENSIEKIKEKIKDTIDKDSLFYIYHQLFNEYISYKYDSAFVYACYTKELATELNNKEYLILSNYNYLYCYTSTGLYKEACDIVENIDVSQVSNEIKTDYYYLCARLYSDMSNFASDTPFKNDYDRKMNHYCDSALLYTTPGTFVYDNIFAFRYYDPYTWDGKINLYLNLLESYDISLHEQAVATCLLGHFYHLKGDQENAIYYTAISAIADIKAAVRETASKMHLALYLYEEGNIMRSSKYIQCALEDANFYNARQRKMEINSIMPIIEEQRLNLIKEQRDTLTRLLIAVGVLMIALIIALVTIYRQIKKLKIAKHSIQNQYNEISLINNKLEEANDIRDQYIIQSLYGKSEYLDTVESLLKKLDRKLKTRQYDDIFTLHKEFNIKTERENVFSSFDQTFLKLFPNFVEEYNKLFKEEDQVSLDEKGNLTPELRIIALMRLGINESERIAKFLNLSINTIYTYKAKMKSKALVPKDEFEQCVMKIKKRSFMGK